MVSLTRRLAFALAAITLAGRAAAQDVLYEDFGRWPGDVKTVARAGDVNGDGRADFIIGARDNFQGDAKGRAWVRSGSDGSELLSIGGDSSMNVDRAIGVGDVDADGFPDIAIAMWPWPGHVHVFSGRTGGLLHHFQGSDQDDEQFGSSVSAADANGDGHADVVVGDLMANFSGRQTGSAFVFSGATGAKLYQWNGVYDYDQFAYAVSGVADLNHDGYDEVMVSQPSMDVSGHVDAGSVFVYSGKNGSRMAWLKGGVESQRFGCSLDRAGDVNHDGYDDLVIGGNSNGPGGWLSGSVFVYSSRDWSALLRVDGMEQEQLGVVVAGGQDVNGDGDPDFIASAGHACYVRLYSGLLGTELFTFRGVIPQGFGYTAALLGDVNGDGCADLAVSDVFHSQAWVYSGNDLFLSASPTNPQAGDSLTVVTAQGKAGGVALLAVVAIDGVPRFLPVATGTFAGNGAWLLAAVAPPGLAGTTIALRAFGLTATGKIADTALATIAFR